MKHKIIYGKSEVELKQFEDNSIDSCVTDPPYNLTSIVRPRPDQSKNGSYGKEVPFSRVQSRMGGFMGKEWDGTGISFNVELWEEVYRIMKPGSHILVAGIARTHHRLWTAIEDAGFTIIDGVYHLFGSGFPKSLSIGKQIDKIKGEEREVIGEKCKCETGLNKELTMNKGWKGKYNVTEPVSEEAKQFEGFGTQLKPSVEIWCLAKKQISERNIAANVLKWGVGGINVDGCRINVTNSDNIFAKNPHTVHKQSNIEFTGRNENIIYNPNQGRFPANLILECCCEEDELVEGKAKSAGWRDEDKINAKSFSFGAENYRGKHYADENGNENCLIHTNPNCVCRMLDEQSKSSKPTKPHHVNSNVDRYEGWGSITQKKGEIINYTETVAGASRFFYQAKASQNERWFYCTICKQAYPMKERDKHIHNAPKKEKYKYLIFHPTVKPEKLIEYLVRLVTPPKGTVLDLFAGTGTTLVSAERENFNSVNIDSNLEYCYITYRRGREEGLQLRMDNSVEIEKINF